MAGQNPPWAWCLCDFGSGVHGICIVLHFPFFPQFHTCLRTTRCLPTKSLILLQLWCHVTGITELSSFGAASASVLGNKEAANSSNMTFTLFDSPRHRSEERRVGKECRSR